MTSNLKRAGFALLFAVNMAANSSAYAASELNDCTCLTAPSAVVDSLGNISSASGDVLYSGINGFELARPGAALVSGSQIMVSSGGAVNISVGLSCRLSIAENSDVSISQHSGPGGDICVNVDNSSPSLAAVPPSLVAGHDPSSADNDSNAAETTGGGGQTLIGLSLVGSIVGLGLSTESDSSPPPASD